MILALFADPPVGWFAVPGVDPELRHERVRDVRVTLPGERFRVEVYDRHHTLPATSVRTLAGELIALPSTPAPVWREIGIADTLDAAYSLGVAALLAGDLVADAKVETQHRERDARRGFVRDREGDRASVAELRRRLDDPSRVVAALGLGRGARRQARGWIVACPAHEDKNPSCSIRVGRDGTLQCKCQACGFSADVLGLIAAVHGLDPRREFKRVLERAGEIAGLDLLQRVS